MSNFEKTINVPVERLDKFAVDMFANVLSSLNDDELKIASEMIKINVNENREISNITFNNIFTVMTYYTKAMNRVFGYDDNIAIEHQNFEKRILLAGNNLSEQEQKNAIESLIQNLTSPLADFFNDHTFADDRGILNHLSLLPPMIRYMLLKDLYSFIINEILFEVSIDRQLATNVIDKFLLSIIKVSDSDIALDWIEKNKMVLDRLDMYEICIDKAEAFRNRPNDYDTFREALPYFEQKWSLENNSSDRDRFGKIIGFYYKLNDFAADILVEDLKELL